MWFLIFILFYHPCFLSILVILFFAFVMLTVISWQILTLTTTVKTNRTAIVTAIINLIYNVVVAHDPLITWKKYTSLSLFICLLLNISFIKQPWGANFSRVNWCFTIFCLAGPPPLLLLKTRFYYVNNNNLINIYLFKSSS